ncbi:sugar transferase [Mesohalobacter halotolerans]|uniref:Sugar transferase n=1 Tax=Mesohalobacter halotolerans TaxID=1883405 RepID=A0A4U5TU02_9FLAO|nr:sugar transferase [Mesohalobacter halotolerans]MBS3739439.1 sugar transferase [Psychroflexus sp.]TKS56974.1 sugar transferase [Mesohalobacter halotolerans]
MISEPLSIKQKFIKRLLDISLSLIGLILSFLFLGILLILTSIHTKSFGLLSQTRIGQYGKPFQLLKLKTMIIDGEDTTFITTSKDPRITKFGHFLRKTKLDELPQLWNVLFGEMSFVGPRPDVSGYADQLEGDDKIILSVKPGITGPASLAFRDEEELLAQKDNPKQYNDEVIWPQKVKINKAYVENYSFKNDLMYVIKTILG